MGTKLLEEFMGMVLCLFSCFLGNFHKFKVNISKTPSLELSFTSQEHSKYFQCFRSHM